jgi:hypothetical protein
MDNDLLEKTEPGRATEPRFSDPRAPEIDDGQDQTQHFRELEIERPKPPLRITLEPPVEYDGKSYSELILDFDAMIGKDFQRAERDFQRLYKADRNEMPLPEMKGLYHSIIASHLANVPLGLILKLPRRYYTPLRTEVLKACGSSSEEESQ